MRTNSLYITLFLNKQELICLHTVKWFHLLLINTNNSIWPINRNLTDTTTSNQCGEASPADCLVSYSGHSFLWGSNSFPFSKIWNETSFQWNLVLNTFFRLKQFWNGQVGWLVMFYGISTIVGYLMPNPLYTSILSINDLVWLGSMTYQPL